MQVLSNDLNSSIVQQTSVGSEFHVLSPVAGRLEGNPARDR